MAMDKKMIKILQGLKLVPVAPLRHHPDICGNCFKHIKQEDTTAFIINKTTTKVMCLSCSNKESSKEKEYKEARQW